MSLSVNDLIGKIVSAIKPILAKYWNDVGDYAEGESAKMAQSLVTIANLKVAGKIDEQQAEALLDMQKHSMQAVLLAVEGIGLIAAQNAINAALDAVKDLVNPIMKFKFL